MSFVKELEDVTNKAVHYGKLAAVIVLLIYILLTLARLYGFTVWPIATFGAQETGVLIAALAYALKG